MCPQPHLRIIDCPSSIGHLRSWRRFMNTAFHPKRLLDIAITLKRHISTASHDGFLNTSHLIYRSTLTPDLGHRSPRRPVNAASHPKRNTYSTSPWSSIQPAFPLSTFMIWTSAWTGLFLHLFIDNIHANLSNIFHPSLFRTLATRSILSHDIISTKQR